MRACLILNTHIREFPSRNDDCLATGNAFQDSAETCDIFRVHPVKIAKATDQHTLWKTFAVSHALHRICILRWPKVWMQSLNPAAGDEGIALRKKKWRLTEVTSHVCGQ